jgi:alpha-1,6-mannosyltransferase
VVSARSALPEVIGSAGLAAPDSSAAFGAAVGRLLLRDPAERRRLARAQAERFGWPAAVDGFLRAHAIPQSIPNGCRGADSTWRADHHMPTAIQGPGR